MTNNSKVDAHPFAGLKVVEYADYPSGEMLGQYFAEMGAEVIKVERPGGALSRHVGPYAKDIVHPDKSLNFWYYNTNKKSMTLDLRDKLERETFNNLLADADCLIATWQPDELEHLGLNYDEILAAYPRLVITSVTPFGLTGPWANYLTSDLISIALGGPLFSCGYDDHSIPPIKPGGPQSYHTAASFAQIGAMLALVNRQATGRGQLVDVSMHESLAVTIETAFAHWAYSRSHVERQTCRHAMPVRSQPAIFLCADGLYVYLILILAELNHWKSLVAWMDSKGLAADLTDPEYDELPVRQSKFDHIQGIIECFFLIHDAEQMFREGQAHNLPIGILNAPEDLPSNPHLQARGFFSGVEYEDVGEVLYPGQAAIFSDLTPVKRHRAPNLGEHNEEQASDLKKALR